jgi:hypothetical protein
MTHNEQLAINSAITQLAEQHNNLCDKVQCDSRVTSIHIRISNREVVACASVKMHLVGCKTINPINPNDGSL